jgi:hypothetical protein
MVGTVKWKIKDDKGKIHSFIIPNTYYSPLVETYYHHNTGHKSGRKGETHTLLPTMMQS